MTIAAHQKIDLKFKIFFFHLILVFSIMILVTFYDLRRLGSLSQDHFESKSHLMAKTLEGILHSMLMDRDITGLEAIAARMTSSDVTGNDILSVSILDRNMQELVVSNQPFPDRESGAVALPGAVIVHRPLRAPGSTDASGFLSLTFTTAPLGRLKVELIKTNLALTLLFSFFAFFWAWLLANLLNRPLKFLVEAAERVTQGEMGARIEAAADDEIGTLIHAFNSMTDTISVHLGELRQKNGELDRRVFELSTLHQAGRAINSVLNLDQLYECIVDTTISVLGGVKRCSLMLVDRRTGEFVIKIAKGLDVGLLPPTRRVPIVMGVAGKVFASGEAQIINDLSDGENSRLLESAQVVRSSLCVPLKGNDEVIGIISASNKISGDPFTGKDLSLMETLGMQSSIAIKNAKLYQDLNRKILELNTLHEVGKTLSMVLDIEKLLELILDMTTRVMGGVKASSLMLWDEETSRLQVKIYKGANRELAMRPIEVGEGIAGKVFERGEPIMVNNMGPNTSESADLVAPGQGVRSSLCVPLRVKEGAIGVLSVSDKLSGEVFDENDLHMLVTLASQIAITLSNAQLYEDLEASYLAAVRALANSLDAKDAYTRGHSERVALYSLEIGKRMKLSPDDLKTLHIGALLHDIGKIGISETIINKTSRLTNDEYELIKTHPVRGASIIEPAKFLKEKVPLIKYHHERFDGKGYPEGLRGETIPLLARIVCVADSYDAMTSKRAYRDTMEKDAATQELVKCSGTQFDAKIVAAFLEVLQDDTRLDEIQKLSYK